MYFYNNIKSFQITVFNYQVNRRVKKINSITGASMRISLVALRRFYRRVIHHYAYLLPQKQTTSSLHMRVNGSRY
jgi:hypothetical protein